MEFDAYDIHSTFLVAEEDGEVVGCTRTVEESSAGLPLYDAVDTAGAPFHARKNIELGRYLVDPAHRGSNLAARLLAETLADAFERSCDCLLVDVAKDGQSSRILRSAGFRKSGLDYHDEDFGAPRVSTVLFRDREQFRHELLTNPSRSQRILISTGPVLTSSRRHPLRSSSAQYADRSGTQATNDSRSAHAKHALGRPRQEIDDEQCRGVPHQPAPVRR